MVNIDKLIELKEKGFIIGEILKKRSYAKRIADFASQLLINWCLVHYCTLTNRERTKNHWKTELKVCFYNMSKLSIKENNSVKNRLKVLKEVWYECDYNLPKALDFTISTKFDDEKIDTKSIKYQYVINDCIKYAKDIFNVILSKNNEIIWNYINSI